MSIGFAILHANRIPVGLDDPHAGGISADEGIDLGLGALALHRPETLMQEFLAGVIARARQFVTELQRAFDGGVGVFGDLQRWIDELGNVRFEDVRLTPWVDRIADLLAAIAPAGLFQRIDGLLERVGIAVPGLAGGSLIDGLLELVFAGLDVLERPRLDGRTDLAAHRGFRMARIIRIWIDTAVQPLRELVRGLDIIGWLRARLVEFGRNLTEGAGGMLRELGAEFATKVRPFAVAIDALLAVRISVSVDASVETLPDQGDLWLDDYQVTPHSKDHPLWWIDLGTNIAAWIHGIIDLSRFNPFYGPRAGDAVLGVIGLAWQTARTIVRAARPDFLKTEDWTEPGAFWFSELGDFCIQTLLRLLGACHEMWGSYGSKFVGSNWVMSIACRLARWYVFCLQPRLPYMMARSIWYLRKWKQQGFVETYEVASGDTIETIASARSIDPALLRRWNRIKSGEQPEVGTKLIIVPDPPVDGANRQRAPISYARYMWMGWTSVFCVGWLFGLIQHWRDDGWEDMQVSGFTGTGFFKKGYLWFLLGFALAFDVIWPMVAADQWAHEMSFDIDYVSLAVLIVMLVIVVLLASASMWSTGEVSKFGTPTIIAGLIGVGLLLVLPVLWAWGGWTSDGKPDLGSATAFLYAWGLIIGLVVFGVLTTLLWWIILDDGRDKHLVFANMDPSKSKYKLPWPKDQVWICGQGFHGIFSHYNSDPNNLYGYDFLEGQDAPAAAARGGLVVRVNQRNAYGNSSQNDIRIQHLDWGETVDPGSELERVTTYSEYIHIAPSRAHIALNHYVLQGQNVVDIDSTGRSAQHHLHYGATAGGPSIPVVFSDEAIRRNRTNPIFRLIRGRGHNPGRPQAQCLYKSDNEVPAKPPGRPLRLTTAAPSTGAAHTHQVFIDFDNMSADGTLSAAGVFTTVADGHRHEIALTQEQLTQLLLHKHPTITTTQVLGHTHTLEPEARAGMGGAVESPNARVEMVLPPPGQLMAKLPRPYDLLGRELVLRVDDELTQIHLFGGDRARQLAELALGRAPRSTAAIKLKIVGGAGAGAARTRAGRFGPREGATQIDDALLGSSVGCRALPILVLETRARGVGDATALAIEGVFGAKTVRGSGLLAEQGAVTGADLATKIAAALASPGLTADPTKLHVALTGTRIDLDYDGNPVSFAGSQRMVDLLGGHYDPSVKQIPGDGEFPLGCGRLALSWGTAGEGLELAIHGRPARLTIEPGPAWLEPAHIADATLRVELGDSKRELKLAATATLADVAATIAREHEGLRAWEQGGKLVVESIDVGADVVVRVHKPKPSGAAAGADFNASATASAPGLTAGAAITDSAMVGRAELVRLIEDALAQSSRRTARATGGAAAIQARFSASRLEIESPGVALGVVAAKSSAELVALLGLTSATPNLLRSGVLAEPIALDAGGWLTLDVGGVELRVDLIGEPARIELPAIEALPDEATLRVKIGTAPGTNFSDYDAGRATSIVALARSLAAHPGLIVRIGHRLVVEARQPGRVDLELDDATAFGFVGRAIRTGHGDGAAVDLHDVDEAGIGAAAHVAPGDPSAVTYTATAPGNDRVTLTAPADHHVQIEWLGRGPDPLGFPSATAASLASEIFDKRAMPVAALRYRVTLVDAAAPTEVATTYAQIAAQPAMMLAARPPSARPLVAGTILKVRVRHPHLDQVAPRELLAELDLGWAADWVTAQPGARPANDVQAELCAKIVEQLQREAPMIDVRRVGDPPHVPHEARLQIETRGGGSDWMLWLEGSAAIFALGFDPGSALQGEVWLVRGTGDVEDRRAARPPELVAAFARAAGRITRRRAPAQYEVTTPALPSPDHGKLTLASAGNTISINASPAALQAALRLATVGTTTEIDAREPLDLPGGTIVVQKQVGTTTTDVAVLFVHGTRARVRSHGSVPAAGSAQETAELDWLAAHPHTLVVEIDGSFRTVPAFPARPATFEAVVEHIGAAIPGACVALSPTRELIVESRTRGSSSRVGLEFAGVDPATALPHRSLLGCTGNLVDGGSGSFHDLAAVEHGAIQAALRHATSTPLQARNLVQANHVAAVAAAPARVRLSGVGARLGTLPGEGIESRTSGMLQPTPSPPALEWIWPGPQRLRACLVGVERSLTDRRRVVMLVWGSPARLEFVIQPSSPSAFSGRRLPLTSSAGPVVVRFGSPRAWPDVTAAIERSGEGRLVARILERTVTDAAGTHLVRRLIITTASEGSGAALSLGPPGPSDARNLLGSQTSTGGQGSVPNLDAVDGPALAAALTGGFAVGDLPEAIADMPGVAHRTYVARFATSPRLLRLRSRRFGCVSSVEPVDGGAPFDFDRSLQRGPARNAALVLGPSPAADHRWTLAAAGKLALSFDGPIGGRRIEVEIPAGAHDAVALARRIHAVLFSGNFGRAGAYADGSIVIETLTSGLAGHIEVDTAVTTAALRPTTDKARGWPASGRLTECEAYRVFSVADPNPASDADHLPIRGLRARSGAPVAAQWHFFDNLPTAAGVHTAQVTLQAAWSADQLANQIDAALRGVGGGIGIARKAVDDTVQIEAAPGGFLYVQIREINGGAPVGAGPVAIGKVEPTRVGEQTDMKVTPGLELRPTDTLRTFRLVYDRKGRGETDTAGDFVDAGWQRALTDSSWGVARRRFDYKPETRQFARGRYLLAARCEAAKFDYGHEAEMIASSSSAEIDGRTVPIVRIARYWVCLRNAGGGLDPMMVGVRTFGDQVLVDWLLG